MAATTKEFNLETYCWKKNINYKKHPEKYRVGKGEQGVLICEPYKSEILPYWKFKTPALAKQSAKTIFDLFLAYLASDDFVGADMARKFLQIGFTRARRYTNYKGGKKYLETGENLPKGTGDPQKAVSAEIFFKKWKKAEKNITYFKMKMAWKEHYG